MAEIVDNNPKINVTVVDSNTERNVASSKNDFSKLLIHEACLADMVKRARGLNLFFTTEVDQAIYELGTIFIFLNTSSIQKK